MSALNADKLARAKSLGMNRTTFRSPHGLPPSSRRIEDGDITTPRDLATLSLHLLKATDIITYSSVKRRTFRPGPKKIEMDNHNHLVGKVAGVDGLKTGFTRGAGFCLAATALRNGRRIIAVTMGSPDSKTRDIKIAELLERGFAMVTDASGNLVEKVAQARAAGVVQVKFKDGEVGAAIGEASLRDFRYFASSVARLAGGVYVNCGSAFILPEVFLKAVALAKNRGETLAGLTTVNIDFMRLYRPQTNVVTRPVAGGTGTGISLVGHHEVLIPLIAAGVVAAE